MKAPQFLTCLIVALFTSFISYAESPFGTGTLKNKTLGVLDDKSVLYASNAGYGTSNYLADPNTLLSSYTYDMYIPPSYDGSEPYGLITWINSGNKGAVKVEEWKVVLDEKKLIWVGGDNIGNDIAVSTRIGVAWAGLLRSKELFNIDEDRVYSAGNSGGARMATSLAYVYPEEIDAVLPQCGSAFPMHIDQDYETKYPDSHYERILSFNANELEYIKSFDQKYGIMTSFGDFREGDIMNIYHNGMEPHNMKARFLETEGNHCSTTAAHFRDAINFVEHAFIVNHYNDFEGGDANVGSKYQEKHTKENNSELVLEGTNERAEIKTEELFYWNDPKGSIVATSIRLDEENSNLKNSKFIMGIHAYQSIDQYCGDTEIGINVPSIQLSIDFSENQPVINVLLANNKEADTIITAFDGRFNDWVDEDQLDIKYHLWDQELRIEFNHHLNKSESTISGSKLLDDNRSIRIRWEETVSDSIFWEIEQWEQGAFLTLSSEKVDGAKDGGTTNIDYVEWIADKPSTVVTLPKIEIVQQADELVAVNAIGNYTWYKNGEISSSESTLQLSDFNSTDDFWLTANHDNGCFTISDTVNVLLTGETTLREIESSLYPNPANSIIFLKRGSFSSEEIKVYTVQGQEVSGLLQFNEVSEGLFQVYVEQLPIGMYKLVNGGDHFTFTVER